MLVSALHDAIEAVPLWFGNLVTMQWFNDVWLKEVFANFMAAKIVSPSFPTVNHNLRFLMSHYPAAYDVDRSRGTHPIQQPLDNLRNAGSVYGAIIYQRAPFMMRNPEAWMGEENFQRGLKDYLTAYAYGNATWDDLVGHLKKYAREDLETWNRAWIKTGGMPEIAVTNDPDGKSFLTRLNDSSSQVIWPQSVDYQIQSKYIHVVQRITFRDFRQVGQEDHAHAIRTGFGQVNIQFGGDVLEKTVGKLEENASAIASVDLGAACAPVVEVL